MDQTELLLHPVAHRHEPFHEAVAVLGELDTEDAVEGLLRKVFVGQHPRQVTLRLLMATFDQLPAEQRAILQLVVVRGQTYDELSGMLGMPAARVRELARDALGDLAPATAARVDSDWRGQIADYVLGQQTGPESTATKGHFKRSEPARAWAYSLLDSLGHLYPNGAMPEIPEADGAAPTSAPAPAPVAPPPPREEPAPAGPQSAVRSPQKGRSGPLSPAAQSVVRR